MKKFIVVACVLAAFTLSSCGYYTCATYAKQPVKKATPKEARI
jgi:hypothetical protein